MVPKQRIEKMFPEYFADPLCQALFDATRTNHHKKVGKLISDQVQGIRYFKEAGDLCLTVAANHGYTAVARILLEAKANPNTIIPKADHNSALHYAALKNRVEILKLILKAKGVLINQKNAEGNTALQLAAREGNEKIIELLLKVEGLLIDEPESQGFTPLMTAAYNGHESSVVLLTEAKADLEARTFEGDTALSIACRLNQEKVATTLLSGKRKANINTLDRNGVSPLACTSGKGNLPIMRLLISEKAEVNGPNNTPCHLPLHLAIDAGHKNAFELLIQSRADINARDKLNRNPLSIAIERNHEHIIRHLLSCNVDIQSPVPLHYSLPDEQQTCHPDNLKHFDINPLMKAACRSNVETVKLLVAHKANVNQGNTEGYTPLSMAVIASTNRLEGSLNVIKFLLEQRADLYSVTRDNKSILDFSLEDCPFIVTKIVLEAIVADAKSNRDLATQQAIINKAINQIFRALMKNLTQDFRELIKFLLSTEPFAKLIRAQADEYYCGGLALSLSKGITRLLEAGLVSVNRCEMLKETVNSKGNGIMISCIPPIIKAASNGNLDTIKALIKAGASPTELVIGIQDGTKIIIETPLRIANACGQEEASQYLLTRELLNSLNFAPKLKSWMTKNVSQIKNVHAFIDQVLEILLSMDPKIGFDIRVGNLFTIFIRNFEFQRLIPRLFLAFPKIYISIREIVQMVEILFFSKMSKLVEPKEANKEANQEGLTVEEFERTFWEVLKPMLKGLEQSLFERKRINEEFLALRKELEQNYRRAKFNKVPFHQERQELSKYVEGLQTLIQDVDKLLDASEDFYHSDLYSSTLESSKVNQGLEKVHQYQEEVEKLEKAMFLARQNLNALRENFEEYWENIEKNIRGLMDEKKKKEALQAWAALKDDSRLNQLSNDADKQWSELEKISTRLSDIKKILGAKRQEECLVEQAALKAEQRRVEARREENKFEREQMKLRKKEVQKRREETLQAAQKQAERQTELERFRVEKKKLAEAKRKEMEIKQLIEKQTQASAGNSGSSPLSESVMVEMLDESDNNDTNQSSQSNDSVSLLFSEGSISGRTDQKVWLEAQYEKFKAELTAFEKIGEIVSSNSADLSASFSKGNIGKILVFRDAMLGLLGRSLELAHYLSPELSPLVPEHAGHLRNVIFRNHSIYPVLEFEKAKSNQFIKSMTQVSIESHLKFYDGVYSFFLVVKKYFKAFVEKEIDLKRLHADMISHPLYEVLKRYKIENQPDLKICRERWELYQLGASLYDLSVDKTILAHARGFTDSCSGVFARHIETAYRDEFYAHRREYRKAIKAGRAYRHVDQAAPEVGVYYAFRSQPNENHSTVKLLSREINPGNRT